MWQRIYWAGGEGIVAAVLLMVGGLGALQTMTIASALPFAVIILIATYGLIKALRVDIAKRESLQINIAPIAPTLPGGEGTSWQERLNNIVDFPNKANVNRFVKSIALPAMQNVAKELETHNLDIQLDIDNLEQGYASLKVLLGEEIDFLYEVKRRS